MFPSLCDQWPEEAKFFSLPVKQCDLLHTLSLVCCIWYRGDKSRCLKIQTCLVVSLYAKRKKISRDILTSHDSVSTLRPCFVILPELSETCQYHSPYSLLIALSRLQGHSMLRTCVVIVLIAACSASIFENGLKKLGPLRNEVRHFAMDVPEAEKNKAESKFGIQAQDLLGKLSSALLLRGAPQTPIAQQQLLPLLVRKLEWRVSHSVCVCVCVCVCDSV